MSDAAKDADPGAPKPDATPVGPEPAPEAPAIGAGAADPMPPLLTPAPPEPTPALLASEPALPAPEPAQPAPVSILPPLLAAPPVIAPTDDRVPRWLRLALFASGLVLGFISILVVRYRFNGLNLPFLIGGVIGALALWPAIIVGLFSIARSFRTPRRRAVVLLWVWGFTILSQLSVLNVYIRHGTRLELRRPSRAAVPAFDHRMSDAPVPERLNVPHPSPVPPVAESKREFDFSVGSDARLIKLIESAQEERYRAIATAYAQVCEERPRDAVIALERLRFIERFAYAEDLTIKEAEQDRKIAADFLHNRFPDAPGTILHRMQRSFGPEFEKLANAHFAQVKLWVTTDRATYYLLRAHRTDDDTLKRSFAQTSFAGNASIEAGLLLLDAFQESHARDATRRLLDHAVFDSAEPAVKVQLMKYHFTAGQNARGIALYEELKTLAPPLVQTSETATRLAAAGLVDRARAILAQLPFNDWNRERLQRERFAFELDYGSAAQAAAEYEKLRAIGWSADPLLRDRFELFCKDPSAGWSAADLRGIATIGAAFLALLLLPAVVLLPVHYWSLLRTRRAQPSAWPGAKWGLREAWAAIGVLACCELAGIWAFQPEEMRSWWGPRVFSQPANVLTDGALLAEQFLVWTGMSVLLVLALWRGGAWRLLGRGEWTRGKVVGVAIAATLALRILLLGYIAIWPDAIEGSLASLSPTTKQLCLALLREAGPGGLILTVAVLVPLLEELFFRGVLLQSLAKHIPFWCANAVQAFLFGAVHENLRLFPFFFGFGLVCGFLARRSGGLLTSIGMHACNNLLPCLVFIAQNR